MEEILYYLLIFVIGFVSSLVGSIVAGNALIAVPSLMLLGIPPLIALASVRLGSLGFKLGALINYIRKNIVVWDLVFPMTIIATVGAIIGTSLVVKVNEEFLTRFIGVAIVVLLPFLFLRKNVGITQKVISKKRRWWSHFLYLIVRTWGGFFSPGAGFIYGFVTMNSYGLTILKSKGTTRIPDVFANIAGIIIFFIAGLINFKIGFTLLAGMFIGGFVGSHIAIKKGDRWLKPVMVAFIVIISIKLIFF